MKRLWRLVAVLFVLALLAGCATVGKDSKNYLEKGMVVDQLKGHRYFYASGEVNLYAFLGLVAIRSAETSVAILADENTGEILKIKTMQRAGQETATARTTGDINATITIVGGYKYKLDDLKGGISYYDIHFTDSWEQALLLVSQLADKY
jgi:hypothetical protein